MSLTGVKRRLDATKPLIARFPERRREMEHGVMGDPFAASAAKGERLFELLVERLSALCREYHAEEPPAYREFGSHCP